MAYSPGVEHSFPMNIRNKTAHPDRTAPFYEGGTSSIAASLISSWRGMKYENSLTQAALDNQNAYTIVSDIRKYNNDHYSDNPPYIINDIYNLMPWVSEKKKYNKEYIKEFIFNGNSVSSTCSINPNFFNSDTSSLYNGPEPYHEDGMDKFYHSIQVVGWDNNYPKENFNRECQPQNNGAWLIQNSYGTEFGIQGRFWISYEDNTLLEAVVYSSLTENHYKSNYQYDYFGWTTSLNMPTKETRHSRTYTTGLMANVFRADYDEYISAVSICTLDENAEYEITVYTDLTDRSMPVTGTASPVTSGVQKYPGFHVITLDDKVRIRQSDYFSVVVKIFNPDTEFTVPIEAGIIANSGIEGVPPIINVISLENEVRDNQSYIYMGGIWQSVLPNRYPESHDVNPSLHFPFLSSSITPTKITYGNVCVKAFSTEYTPLPYDSNDDGIVNSRDTAFVVHHIMSGDPVSYGSENRFCDFDKDGEVTCTDLILLTNVLLEQ